MIWIPQTLKCTFADEQVSKKSLCHELKLEQTTVHSRIKSLYYCSPDLTSNGKNENFGVVEYTKKF